MILGGSYYQIGNTVFCYGLTPIQIAVYSYLLSCAGQKGKCWPAMKTIAACCGCSKNAARDAVNELERRKFIRKTETFRDETNGKKRQVNNTYYILELPDNIRPPKKEPVYRETPVSGVNHAVENHAG